MAINFPSSPTDGQSWVDQSSGTEWIYNSSDNSWTIASTGAASPFNWIGQVDVALDYASQDGGAYTPQSGDQAVQNGSTNPSTAHANWSGIVGDSVADGVIIVFDGSAWSALNSSVPGYPDINDDKYQNGTIDDRYLSLASDAGAQVVLATAETEFKGNITTAGPDYNYFKNNIGGTSIKLDQGALVLGWNHGSGDRASAFVTTTNADGTAANGGFRFYTKTKDDIQSEWVAINGYGQLTVGGYTFTDDAKLTVKTLSTSPASEYTIGIKANANFDTAAASRDLYVGFNSFGNLSDSDSTYPVIDRVNHYSCSNNNFKEGVRNAVCYNSGVLQLNPDPDGLVAGEAYGFYSNISAQPSDLLLDGTPATFKYNFYAAGNAPNYFRGSILKDMDGGGELTIAADPANYTNYDDNGIKLNYSIFCTRTSATPIDIGRGVRGDTTLNDANNHQVMMIRYKGSQAATIVVGTGGAELTGFTRVANPSMDSRVFTPSEITNASTIIKQLEPKQEGFAAEVLQAVVPQAVTGTENDEQAIGTIADYDGTVLETAVTEPSAEELTYTEDVEVDGVTTATVRTRTWTATGTQPVYQGVDQTKLIPLLTKALQEALERIEALENA